MNPQQFQTELKKKQSELKRYLNLTFPLRAGRIAVRFINGNFRAQGWQGGTFQRWKKTAGKALYWLNQAVGGVALRLVQVLRR